MVKLSLGNKKTWFSDIGIPIAEDNNEGFDAADYFSNQLAVPDERFKKVFTRGG